MAQKSDIKWGKGRRRGLGSRRGERGERDMGAALGAGGKERREKYTVNKKII